jgi:penicillin amidase
LHERSPTISRFAAHYNPEKLVNKNMLRFSVVKLAVVLTLSLLPVAAVCQQTGASSVAAEGLRKDVTVQRDGRSIPYISATSDDDLYFVQGYVTACDRLWQMDMLRRLARGETAEIFGRATLEEDKRWRRFGFAKIADDSLQYLSPELRSALDSYARGVNAYIASLSDPTLPIEFKILQYKPRNWTPADSIIIGKILADALSTTWRSDLLKASLQNLPIDKFADISNQVTPYDVVLFGLDKSESPRKTGNQPIPSTKATAAAERDYSVREASLSRVGLYAEELAASNNWVISGKRTADGKAILANDPHLLPSAPGIWYLVHLSSPTMRVAGVTFPGVPGVVLGHNGSIAWGATNVGPDVQDLYYETFENGKYKTPEGWSDATVRNEQIKVRTNPLKTDTEAVSFEVVSTRNGPVILEDGGRKYALKWTAFDPKNTEFEAFFRLNRANNWDDFKSALRTYGGAAQNFVYADVKGNIGWYAAGRIPIRKTGDGSLPYDGSTNAGDWVGFIPFEELPNLYNPPSGLIVTANQRTVGTSYKYQQFIRDAALPWRARRIYDSLNGKSKITMDDVRDAQYDVYNIPLANLAKEIVKLSAASDSTLSELKQWDGKMTAGSRAALLANEIRGCLADKIATENRPVPATAIRERVLDSAVRDQSTRWLPKQYKDYGQFVRACDSESRASLADPKRLGPDESKWVWGAVFQSRFTHPLTAVPFIGGQFATPVVPLDGSGQTPDVGPYVSMRLIASPGNWDATRHVIPLGESGDPRSPSYKDQFDNWKNGTPAIFPFSEEAVKRAAVNTVVFRPGQ